MEDLNKRRGFIRISNILTENPQKYKDDLAIIFSEFYPIWIDRNTLASGLDSNAYYGFSSHFRVIEPGIPAPEYRLEITLSDHDRVRKIKFYEVEE